MKPYYQHAGITIYHGDCRDVLRAVPMSVDLLLTDPPYSGLAEPIEFLDGGVAPRSTRSMTVASKCGTISTGDWLPLAWARAMLGAMVFCSYHFIEEIPVHVLNGRRVALLTWHKRNAPNAVNNVPRFTTEFVWCFQRLPGLKWRNIGDTLLEAPFPTAGCVSNGERVLNDDTTAAHPAQKPLSIMARLVSVGPSTVLDPFMGTGTTLRAVKDAGLQAIGIEIEERYCEIAAKRLAQEVLQF